MPNIKNGNLLLADETKLKAGMETRNQLRVTHPEVIAEFNRMKETLQSQGRALSTEGALSWISKELMKRGPTGGIAWTQMNKKDKLRKLCLMLADVESGD